MLLRLILLAVLFYWGAKLIAGVYRMLSGQSENKVNGNPKKDNRLDLSQHDVEDADFEEID